MNEKYFSLLKCIDCNHPKIETSDLGKTGFDGDVIDGILKCPKCERTYEIENSILKFLPLESKSFDDAEMKSSDEYSNRENHLYLSNRILLEIYSYSTRFLLDSENYNQETPILDIGCGNGFTIQKMMKHFKHFIGIDLSLVALKNAMTNTGIKDLIQCNVNHLPFKDSVFEYIVSSDLFHHLLEPHLALKEIVRICTEGGVVFIQDRNFRSVFVKTMDFLANKGIIHGYKEETFIKNPINSRLIRNQLRNMNYSSEIIFHDLLVRPGILILGKLNWNCQLIIRGAYLFDKILGKIPILNQLLAFRYTIKFKK